VKSRDYLTARVAYDNQREKERQDRIKRQKWEVPDSDKGTVAAILLAPIVILLFLFPSPTMWYVLFGGIILVSILFVAGEVKNG
jgi:hypothetical protein